MSSKINMIRCEWANDPVFWEYHDKEWGKPVHDDRLLFEMLTLEGAQAGLSWKTILQKRENYKKAFDNFDVKKIVKYDDKKIAELLQNEAIIRNKLKVNSSVINAKAFIEIQKEFGNFDKYIWSYVDNKPLINNWESIEKFPAKTDLSDQISKDLKKRGFKFVGSTIIYAYMQAIGMVNDHEINCNFK